MVHKGILLNPRFLFDMHLINNLQNQKIKVPENRVSMAHGKAIKVTAMLGDCTMSGSRLE